MMIGIMRNHSDNSIFKAFDLFFSSLVQNPPIDDVISEQPLKKVKVIMSFVAVCSTYFNINVGHVSNYHFKLSWCVAVTREVYVIFRLISHWLLKKIKLKLFNFLFDGTVLLPNYLYCHLTTSTFSFSVSCCDIDMLI